MIKGLNIKEREREENGGVVKSSVTQPNERSLDVVHNYLLKQFSLIQTLMKYMNNAQEAPL